ncbi:autotransporter outer membrane beta-barrel domain-containing protein [Helicobacter sp. 16-1353]|uniref:autotransporter outer membrane beta-barrel domain-containing protein n=1 Tax=Helicobacter sp. 16-1353 TaxID=2004996 RepID=UPI0011BDBCF9|nr:autotransporter outer membrane beta-barrel domain-containing protein [Helicobacter sp. 16-1353]
MKSGNNFRANIDIKPQTLTKSIGNTTNKANTSNINLVNSNIKTQVFKNSSIGFSGNLASNKRDLKRKNLESLRIAKIRENLKNKNVESNETLESNSLVLSVASKALSNADSSFQSNDRFYRTEDSIVDFNLRNNDDKHQVFFTPFMTHSILDSNNISGYAFGLVSGFSSKIGESNTLGAHIGFSSGKVSGNNDNNSATIRHVLLAIGAHYKLDLAYDMYVKALLDIMYIRNEGNYRFNNSPNIAYATPQSSGYSLSVYYGKNFDFKSAGIFGMELGLESTGLNTDDYSITQVRYKAGFYNLLYVDLGFNYRFAFENGFGIDTNLGYKYALNNPKGEVEWRDERHNYDLGFDKYIAYLGLGVNYNINESVNIGLNYLGNFGDKTIQNSGFFNVKVGW